MTTATAKPAATTFGDQLRQSPAVRNAISAIVDEVRARSAQITDVCGPRSPELAASYKQVLDAAATIRGRPIYYPYVGSGIGNGPFVELLDGSVKLDMLTGIGPQFFGHSDPELVAVALEAATSNVVQQGHLVGNEEAVRFAETILDCAKKSSRMAHCFLTNSGVMANENALKICFQKNAPASRVLAFEDCFVGRTWTMSQIGDTAGNRMGLPLNALVDYLPFYDPAAARDMAAGDQSGQTRFIDASVKQLRRFVERYPGQYACFTVELVQGEGGLRTAPPEFFRELFKVCKDAGIAIWDDEIQTFGRTTSMFAYEALGLGQDIDVICFGKITQVCGVLYRAEFNPKPGLLSATFLGSTDALRVGRRVVERLRDGDFYGPTGRNARHHDLFVKHCRAFIAKHPQWFPPCPEVTDLVGGIGGMMRFTPYAGKKDPVYKLCNVLFDEGLITFYCGHGPYHVRMLPPVGAIDESIWPRVFQIIESAMAKVHS